MLKLSCVRPCATVNCIRSNNVESQHGTKHENNHNYFMLRHETLTCRSKLSWTLQFSAQLQYRQWYKKLMFKFESFSSTFALMMVCICCVREEPVRRRHEDDEENHIQKKNTFQEWFFRSFTGCLSVVTGKSQRSINPLLIARGSLSLAGLE